MNALEEAIARFPRYFGLALTKARIDTLWHKAVLDYRGNIADYDKENTGRSLEQRIPAFPSPRAGDSHFLRMMYTAFRFFIRCNADPEEKTK